MNGNAKTRFVHLIRTFNSHYFRRETNEKTFHLRNSCDLLYFNRRELSTRINLVRNERKRLPVRKKDEIGAFGYSLLAVPVVTFCLGVWQIQRRQWKLALVADLQKRTSETPIDIPEDLSQLAGLEYHPVTIRGKFLYDKEFFIGPKSLIIKGAGASESAGGVLTPGTTNTGFCVVTPFQLENRDLTILVNRGWISLKNVKEQRKMSSQSNDVVEVTGLIRLNETRPPFAPKSAEHHGKFMYRDLDAMAKYADTAPVYIELIASESIRGGPVAGQTRIALRNEHLSYIITWFSLSGMTGWMWYRQFIKKLPIV